MVQEMSNVEKAIKIARSPYFTGLARLIMLVALGADTKRQIIQSGLGSSTMYTNIIKGIEQGLIVIYGRKIALTEKGKQIAQILLECFERLESLNS